MAGGESRECCVFRDAKKMTCMNLSLGSLSSAMQRGCGQKVSNTLNVTIVSFNCMGHKHKNEETVSQKTQCKNRFVITGVSVDILVDISLVSFHITYSALVSEYAIQRTSRTYTAHDEIHMCNADKAISDLFAVIFGEELNHGRSDALGHRIQHKQKGALSAPIHPAITDQQLPRQQTINNREKRRGSNG